MSAIRDILSASEVDFAAELKEKQEVLDKTNAALKESGNALVEEKRKLEDLQAKVREKTELDQKIKNLRRTTDELRAELSGNHVQVDPGLEDSVSLGEADKGLDLDGRLRAVEHLFPNGAPDPSMPMSPEQTNFLSAMERAEVLSGRAMAYQHHNQQLERKATILKRNSTELEERYRKIVSLCTGAERAQIDGMLDSLLQAVVSEQREDAELDRLQGSET